MEPADLEHGSDGADFRELHGPRLGRVLGQRQVSARPVVILEVLGQHTAKMALVEHDDVVEALTTNGSDEPLHVGILPG